MKLKHDVRKRSSSQAANFARKSLLFDSRVENNTAFCGVIIISFWPGLLGCAPVFIIRFIDAVAYSSPAGAESSKKLIVKTSLFWHENGKLGRFSDNWYALSRRYFNVDIDFLRFTLALEGFSFPGTLPATRGSPRHAGQPPVACWLHTVWCYTQSRTSGI